MSRPASIWQFERVLLAATLVEAFNQAITLSQARTVLDDPALAKIGLGLDTYVAIAMIGPCFALLVWFYIARRASAAALWLYVGLVALATAAAIQSLWHAELLAVTRFVQAISLGLHNYGAWLLFRPDSRAWFRQSTIR